MFVSDASGNDAGVPEDLKQSERTGYRAPLVAIALAVVALVVVLVIVVATG